MPRIILVRPGQTDCCLRNAMLGRYDADLNETGRQQAKTIAWALEKWDVSFIGVSPLKRAIATAIPIEDLHEVPIHPVGGFQGVDLGDWENKDFSLIYQSDKTRYQSWLTDPDFRAPGGESTRVVYARAYPELVRIVEHAREGETIVLVLQEGVLQALCCAVMDLPLETAPRFYLEHGAFGVFERLHPGGPYQIVGWNYHQHLPQSEPSWEYEEELPGV